MSALILRNRYQGHATLVENEFIDHYMAKSSGEYVKVYLLLLRHMNNPCVSLSISQLADHLDHTEGDIIRALKYWEKEHLLTLEYDDAGNVIGIELGKVPGAAPSEPAASPINDIPAETAPADGTVISSQNTAAGAASSVPAARKTSASRKELKQLLFITEQYLGKTLTRTDVDMITYFYDTLGFSSELIEYLIEYCVENGHKSMHYIQKVALSWSDEHITKLSNRHAALLLFTTRCAIPS